MKPSRTAIATHAELLKHGPLTTHEIAVLFGVKTGTAWRRMERLAKLKLATCEHCTNTFGGQGAALTWTVLGEPLPAWKNAPRRYPEPKKPRREKLCATKKRIRKFVSHALGRPLASRPTVEVAQGQLPPQIAAIVAGGIVALCRQMVGGA